MFNGIIEQIAMVQSVKSLDKHNRSLYLKLSKKLKPKAKLGDSIAINGVCLTIEDMIGQNNLIFTLGKETLEVTNFKNLNQGDWLNLETAMKFGSEINGHLLSGHIDGVGKIQSIKKNGKSYQFEIVYPKKLAPFIAQKGSIAIDGVSLTINQTHDQFKNNQFYFSVNIIPFTFNHTLFSHYKMLHSVNLEVDLLARYIHRQSLFQNK